MDSERGRWKFTDSGAFVERDCLLFEAGDYPERAVTITPDDLRAIAENSPGAIPVKVEHLSRSPFDGALGTVGRLRAVGGRLWGTLRQPADAWRFVQRAGAKALSIALDTTAWRIAEVSFVCQPRVASAQVFHLTEGAQPPGHPHFQSPSLFPDSGGPALEEDMPMVSVRQFADGLMQYVRTVVGGDAA